MGYRGRLLDQERARLLRSQSWTLAEIAAEVKASKGQVSLWVRDVEFDERARKERELERKASGQAVCPPSGPERPPAPEAGADR